MEKYCTVFIASEESQLTQSEIQKSLESGKMDDKIKVIFFYHIGIKKSCNLDYT